MKRTLFSSLFGIVVGLHSSWAAADDEVVIYPSFTAGDAAVVEGRVVERKNNGSPTREDGKRQNLRRNMELMINNERKNHPVSVRFAAGEWPTLTDQEGYFRVVITGLNAVEAGWHVVTAATERGQGASGVLKVPAENGYGLISDIDDTILITEVNSKRHMLANTFLNNATQRMVVPGIVDFYRGFIAANPKPDSAPIIYLSASPKQLHTNIEHFLVQHEFPRGVLTTKRVTDDDTSEPITDQVAYKTRRIEAILATLPHVTFTLVGDDGEHDPEIYADIRQRFPDRIAAIWIRQVNPDLKRPRLEGQGVLDEALNR
jgi:phosphatidate phosphatase APP1